jgi:hypothetical protein
VNTGKLLLISLSSSGALSNDSALLYFWPFGQGEHFALKGVEKLLKTLELLALLGP